MSRIFKHPGRLTALLVALMLLAGCGAYFNTFYNARRAFNTAESERKDAEKNNKLGRIRTDQYKLAIEKALKVVENHPNSSYYDDAVYVLGVSYFYTDQYAKAERRFREILANYGDSKFARDSRLYLAKSMLEQNDIDDAMAIFEELFTSDVSRQFKSEAAMALGNYHFENEDFATAEQYYLAIRDSLGTGQEKRQAQRQIADGLFQQYRWTDALDAYLQILGMDPDKDQRYHALFRAADCVFRLQRIETGLDYLQTLADEEIYFDSLSVLRLKMAEGYDWAGDVDKAEEIYKQVSEEALINELKAQAFYNLGLIYQFDYDQLTEAKDYYDQAVQAGRSSEWGQEALQLSSNIGKLDEFERTIEIDSTTTQAMIDEAAYTQYQLAELYWFQLNKPDTAMLEMEYVVDSFPTAYDAPKAMIALAQMAWQQEEDSSRGDSLLRQVLDEYPHSDFVPEALQLLDLTGTEADTGYPLWYVNRAEQFLLEEENIDSARTHYQTVVDRFPESKYYLQSRFALVWLTEMYSSPGDSSVVLAYTEFADSFPNTEWGREAQARLQYTPRRRMEEDRPADTAGRLPDGRLAEMGDDTTQQTEGGTYSDFQRSLYVDPDGELAFDVEQVNLKILEVREPFVYPTEAYTSKWEGDLYFQIKLDFSGQVVDYIQKTFSDIEEINIRAEEELLTTTFDTREVPPDALDRWYVYKKRVVLPDHLR